MVISFARKNSAGFNSQVLHHLYFVILSDSGDIVQRLGHWAVYSVTRVRIPVSSPFLSELSVSGSICGLGPHGVGSNPAALTN